MPTSVSEETFQTLEIIKDELIAAPIDIVFETILEQMGPYNEGGDKKPMPMKLEAWPGGRWYRDLGNNAGHYWGHVQAINPPTLLEIYGPLFMSGAVISNVQYRLTAEQGGTRIKFVHRASGAIAPEYRDGRNINAGWGGLLARIREQAEKKREGK